MDIKMHKAGKKRAGKVTVSDTVFDVKYNEPLIHQVKPLPILLAGQRR